MSTYCKKSISSIGYGTVLQLYMPTVNSFTGEEKKRDSHFFPVHQHFRRLRYNLSSKKTIINFDANGL